MQKTVKHQTLFIQEFIQNFFHVGAALPSSSALGLAGVAYLAQKQGQVRVLEAGAGTGSFTREIIPLLEDGDVLDVVEINPALMRYLDNRFQQDPAFQTKPGVKINMINGDIRSLNPIEAYDYIIFSLPLTNFPPKLVQDILTLMMQGLKPGGVFSYVKYIFISRFKYLFGNDLVKAEMEANGAILGRFANQYQIDQRAVVFNVPPTWVYYWQKPGN